MTPQDLKHLERIFKRGAVNLPNGELKRALYDMGTMCKEIRREEENATDGNLEGY